MIISFVATLHDHITGKVASTNPPGPHTVLTTEEEAAIEEWLIHMAKIGYGRSREQLKVAVKKIIELDGRPNPFIENMPGRTWIRAFLKRHPKVSCRHPEPLPTSRAMGCSEQHLDKWFKDFGDFLKENDLLNKPEQIWNADESGFPLHHRSGTILAPRGSKSLYSITSANKQQITTLACINAAGQCIPPMHVFPGERFRSNPLEGAVPGAYFGRSESGWMDSELFYGWLSGHFVSSIPPARPVVLLLDGHSSHINLETAKFARDNGILLYCLQPHTTHVLQPCDVGLFKPLKGNWNKCVNRYIYESSGEVLNKYTFARVFKDAWLETVKPSTIINSFRRSGICPLNRAAITKDKTLPSTSMPTEADEEVSPRHIQRGYTIKSIRNAMYSSALKHLEKACGGSWLVHRLNF